MTLLLYVVVLATTMPNNKALKINTLKFANEFWNKIDGQNDKELVVFTN
jgi:hypothetical protein